MHSAKTLWTQHIRRWDINQFRAYLGIEKPTDIGTSSNERAGRPQVLLIGHHMTGDVEKIKQAGIEVSTPPHFLGYVDTQLLVKDHGTRDSESLSGLMKKYGFADLVLSKPLRKKAQWVFAGAHNAGNDAVATLKVALAQAFHTDALADISSSTQCEGNDHGRDSALERSHGKVTAEKRPEIHKAIVYNSAEEVSDDTFLLAYDSEGVTDDQYKPMTKNRISEHGFAWLPLADVAHVLPGYLGRNWHPFIRARHWINEDFRKFRNKDYLVGDPHGFWKKYGESQLYYGKDSKPFQLLFEEIAAFRPKMRFFDSTRQLKEGDKQITRQ